ncbi:MAG TPA: alanine racemase [Streptosporangiaceae bacterium]|jgi:D-serine deaminase-like pyridoxal phosphate-dependent protein|nr:alanine racemase [Streptosporangiaceae bacterium]
MSDWQEPWRLAQERVTDLYGRHVGEQADALPTPALVVDTEALDRNLAAMNAALAGQTARLRPHTKVQKSPDIALRQIAAGAVGVAVASVWEAAAMAAAGVSDVLIANQVVPADKVNAAAALAGYASLTVAVDDARNIEALSAAAARAGTEIGVLVEVDVGMGRCGARSAPEALRLAEQAHAAPGLRLKGVQAYEGHCMLVPDREKRIRMATRAMDTAAEALALMRSHGLPAGTLSGGGTGTYDITGRHPAVTELQAGSYVFMDAMHGNLVSGFEISLTVLTTVVARHGHTVILDAGRKSVGIDFVSPPLLGHDYTARYFAEEHAMFDTDERFGADVGDRVRLVSGYAPTTVNLHDVLYAVRGGQVEQVWPVFPRGAGHGGFLTALLPG